MHRPGPDPGTRVREEHVLQDGDGFEIGGTNFVFHSEQFEN